MRGMAWRCFHFLLVVFLQHRSFAGASSEVSLFACLLFSWRCWLFFSRLQFFSCLLGAFLAASELCRIIFQSFFFVCVCACVCVCVRACVRLCLCVCVQAHHSPLRTDEAPTLPQKQPTNDKKTEWVWKWSENSLKMSVAPSGTIVKHFKNVSQELVRQPYCVRAVPGTCCVVLCVVLLCLYVCVCVCVCACAITVSSSIILCTQAGTHAHLPMCVCYHCELSQYFVHSSWHPRPPT